MLAKGSLPPRPVPAPARPRGAKKAIIAVAASMLTAAYHMLRTGAVYDDLGERYFDARDRAKLGALDSSDASMTSASRSSSKGSGLTSFSLAPIEAQEAD